MSDRSTTKLSSGVEAQETGRSRTGTAGGKGTRAAGCNPVPCSTDIEHLIVRSAEVL